MILQCVIVSVSDDRPHGERQVCHVDHENTWFAILVQSGAPGSATAVQRGIEVLE